MKSTARICSTDGCPVIVIGGNYCDTHTHAPWATSTRPGSTRASRKVRAHVLRRDPTCTCQGCESCATSGCPKAASGWPGYQRWLEPKWKDPAEVGGAKVDIPLRAIPNCVRELQEHRRKRLDSPLSVTEWARMLLLFAVDHPSGFKNLFRLTGVPGKAADRTVSLAHRLHSLAAVRNLVTHRASAGVTTLTAFRKIYYAAFEDLVALA